MRFETEKSKKKERGILFNLAKETTQILPD